MFTHISNLLPRAMVKKGIKRQAEAAHVCEKFRQIAPELLPPEVYEHVRVQSFKNKVLTIAVKHPVYAAEINNYKHRLTKSINDALGKQHIASIRTVLEEKVNEIA